MKKLIFCFDGTCNSPDDVGDFSDDASISNILKLHLFFGGTLSQLNSLSKPMPQHSSENVPDQQSFYYSGIGNRGNWLLRTFNAAFAPAYGEMHDIISEAHIDLNNHYSPGDEIYIFGFSRGAAIARMFAAHLTMPVTFLGVFDTVAATQGSLDLDPDTFPASGIVFENDVLAPHIKRALHILALDEKRLWLQPTLFNHDERITEVWFAGSHSDIGGGYWFDGLSDVSLQFMLANIVDELTVLPWSKLNEAKFKIPNSKEVITFDDIVINPLVNGKLHSQLYPYGHTFTHNTRLVRINVNELPSQYLPLVHISVAQRFQLVVEYRPYALRNVSYQIMKEKGDLSQQRFGVSGLTRSGQS